jgi:hypothetical protein
MEALNNFTVRIRGSGKAALLPAKPGPDFVALFIFVFMC